MKAKILLGLVTAALLMNGAWNPADSFRPTLLGGTAAHAGVRVDFGFFYNELAPYGDWRQIEPYNWVWYPDVTQDWRPYSVGYWVFTDDHGWTWISTDPWGSIPFHYGRWFYDGDYGGWAWVPGTEWGPAWVSWRSGGGYIGWAPLLPEMRFEHDVKFFSPRQDSRIGRNSWCFVPASRFLSPRMERVILPRPRNVTLIKNTTNVTRYLMIDRRVVNRSIDLGRFERETRTQVVRYRIDETDRPMRGETPVRNGRVVLFRPQISRIEVTPPPAVRPPRLGIQGERRPEHRIPDTAPSEHQRRDRERNWRDQEDWPRADQHPRNGRRSVEFEEWDDQRPSVEQERLRQRPTVERKIEEDQHQETEKERARRRVEREQRQQGEQERVQRQAEREQARQQQQQVEQQEKARQQQQQVEQQEKARQREQEKAQRQAEREAQRQAEREQARQQQQQVEQQEKARQREQEKAQRQAEREAQRQAEREQARQQQQQVEQQEKAQQREQEKAQRQAERQAKREQARQQQQQVEQQEKARQREQEKAQRQAEREQAQ
ncbi:MAG: hypothetical protein H6974_04270 [Gammaproteobacteria bacterium]|nr:hypothetical protein [Gammaproteobacteria bacterium]MCP5195997.1 hypothetical protein [Gammaproteobacteria bacterium]